MKPLSYYVYYRTEAPAPADLRAAAEALFGELRAATGVQGRLLRRRDDPSTWMEIYENVADGPAFESALDAALAKTGFSRLQLQRKTEIFTCA